VTIDPPSPSRDACRLAELLAGLSLATDLGHGQVEESAIRSCLLSMRLCDRLGIRGPAVDHTYYATLLRHIGCTAFAHEEARMFGGDEIDTRAAVALIDNSNPRQVLAFTMRDVGRTAPALRRAGAVAKTLTQAPRLLKQLAASNCEVGSLMARRIGLPEAVQAALFQVFECWNGKGLPRGLRGEEISPPARLSHVATHAMALAYGFGAETAVRIIAGRAGSLLDPEAVAALVEAGPEILPCRAEDDVWAEMLEREPSPRREIRQSQIDTIASAFADFADLKLTFTRGHSSGVADLVAGAGNGMGLSEVESTNARRAALFHDLGRVAIPNGIWEKPGALGVTQWERVRLHPYHAERMLNRSPILHSLAPVVGMHHERQDGSGYYRRLEAAAIPPAARLLAAADVYQAMTQPRPHRPAKEPAEAASELERLDRDGKLDPRAVQAVLEFAGHAARRRQQWPAGLTEREVEVLRLIASGAGYKDVGKVLVISPRTAAHHVQHIYNKIGVSTRAGAAMFAMENRLVAT